jgi:hypothetical protein
MHGARHGALANQGVSESLERHYKSNRDKRAGNNLHLAGTRHHNRDNMPMSFLHVLKGWDLELPVDAT